MSQHPIRLYSKVRFWITGLPLSAIFLLFLFSGWKFDYVIEFKFSAVLGSSDSGLFTFFCLSYVLSFAS